MCYNQLSLKRLKYMSMKPFSKLFVVVDALIITLFVSTVVYAAATGALFPSSDGNYRQWYGNTLTLGNNHYFRVDETVCNTTDYNYTTTVGAVDSYRVNLSSIPDGSTVTGITVTPCAAAYNQPLGDYYSLMRVFVDWYGLPQRTSPPFTYLFNTTIPVVRTPHVVSGISVVKESDSVLEVGAIFDDVGGVLMTTRTDFMIASTAGIRLSQMNVNITYTLPGPLATNAPTNLRAMYPHLGINSALLRWADRSNDEFGFVIERSINGTNFTVLANVAANTTQYADNTLDPFLPSGRYYYRVRGYRMFPTINSAFTNTASVFLGGIQ